MKNRDSREGATRMNYIALRQTVQGKMIIFNGSSMETENGNYEMEAYREIGGAPVYHICKTGFNLPMFPEERWSIMPKRWGGFYHPYLMIGMPSVGGSVDLYVTTRFPGWYVMFAKVKMDEWGIGKSDAAMDVVCWTPKLPRDNYKKAGSRLFKALVLQMDGVEDDNWTTQMFSDENWESEWNPSASCLEIFKDVRD